MSTSGITHIPDFGTGATISTRQAGDVAIFDISGRLTLGPALTQLAGLIKVAIESGGRKILLNLAEVSYIDSSGIGELTGSMKLISGKGGELKLLQASKRVQDLMRLVGVHPLFVFERDETEAFESFSTRP